MNILIESRAFYPSVGGLEMMSRGLATAWQGKGCTVHIQTMTPLGNAEELQGLHVDRRPTARTVLQNMRWADVFVQSGISLRSLHGPLLVGTPLIMIHHNLLSISQSPPIRTWLKRQATHLGVNVAVSRSVLDTIPGPVVRIPNTFRPVFDQPGVDDSNRNGLLFVGRLVSVKGADLAIEALRQLHERGVSTTLTIYGDWPERAALEQEVEQAGIGSAVTFEGWTGPEELAAQYRTSNLLLVPSRHEPFGIVALEAIASGCPVVASRIGGLPEAVGDCGLLVPPGDPAALADATERTLRSDVQKNLRAAMPTHVRRHRIDRIATDYLHLLRRVVRGKTWFSGGAPHAFGHRQRK